MKTFLTSDLHFNHVNILKYCNRPYSDVGEMQEMLIHNWNSVVEEGDIVYNLGDLSLRSAKHKDWYKQILQRLNGRHILILGNHDYMKPYQYLECGIESVHTSLIVKDILLAHNPAIATAIPKDMMMFCGHIHDTFKKLTSPKKILNVGVDVQDYKPIEWNKAVDSLLLDPSDDYKFEDLKAFGRHGTKSTNK